MAARHLAVLPLSVEVDHRRLDALTARAIRLGLRPDIDEPDAVAELLPVAENDHALISAAIARIERAQDKEWTRVGARAAELLRAARMRR